MLFLSSSSTGRPDAEDRSRGRFSVEEENYHKQVRRTVEHLRRGRAIYLSVHGQDGKVDTAAYALWTLKSADWQADDTTNVVAVFFVWRTTVLTTIGPAQATGLLRK